jgi:NADH-quinone oxidoreductase subunit C
VTEEQEKTKEEQEQTLAQDSSSAAAAAAVAAESSPSPNQLLLNQYKAIISESFAKEDPILEAKLNEHSDDIPTLVVDRFVWFKVAKIIKEHPDIAMNYLRNLSGVDQETHLEVVYHFVNMSTNRELCVKIKTDREDASIPSITPLWSTANWTEREVYDLLGIEFPGHPDLRRIMMPDDWVGYPLRKDYEPIDPEV